MFEFLKRRLKDNKGAIDKIIVTLVLVVVGVAGTVTLDKWMDDEISNVSKKATNKINNSLN